MSPEKLTLRVTGNGLDERDVDATRRSLEHAVIRAVPGARVEKPRTDAGSGKESDPRKKGDPITLGAIVIAGITSGAVSILFDCIRQAILRQRTAVIEIESRGGRKIKVNMTNISDGTAEKMLEDAIAAANGPAAG